MCQCLGGLVLSEEEEQLRAIADDARRDFNTLFCVVQNAD
jgi:hypothetical protein